MPEPSTPHARRSRVAYAIETFVPIIVGLSGLAMLVGSIASLIVDPIVAP